jgi:acyl-CoA thioesterase I
MLRLASWVLVCSLFALPVPSWAGSESDTACGAPAEYITADGSMTQVATAIAGGGPVDVLAVGSATTIGSMTVTGEQTTIAQGSAFPWRMIAALHKALPNVQFRITVRGGRGMTAEQMLPLIQAALKQQRYPLVLWQTGTVEAVRGLGPDGLLDVLHSGAEQVRDAGGDLVLIDPQFSRFLRANTDMGPYEGVLQQVAGLPGVSLFRRFDLTQAWVNDGQVDLERVSRDQRDETVALLNACLGHALARYVLAGAEAH